MKLKACGKTDVGSKRMNNEDYYLVASKKGLFIVADGMGGHNAGEVASQLAVEKGNEFLSSRQLSILRSLKIPQRRQEDFAQAVREAVNAANKAVLEAASRKAEHKGMACTYTLALVDDSTLHIGHVGDTRAYLVRDRQIECLTEDHSVVGEMVRAGYISREEARLHPKRNIVTRSVGHYSRVQVDYVSVPLQPGDYIILCSDGLWDMLSDDSIRQIVLESKKPSSICQALITAANEAGGEDNVTVIVLHVD